MCIINIATIIYYLLVLNIHLVYYSHLSLFATLVLIKSSKKINKNKVIITHLIRKTTQINKCHWIMESLFHFLS